MPGERGREFRTNHREGGSLLGGELSCRKALLQFSAEAIEAAVGHDEYYVAGICVRRKEIGDGIGGVEGFRGFSGSAQSCNDALRRKTLCVAEEIRAIYGAENDRVSSIQSGGERRFEHVAAHGIRSRLKRGPNFAAGPAGSGSFESGANRGGMMREIVNDENAGGFAANLEAAAHSAKSGAELRRRHRAEHRGRVRSPRRRAR